MGAGREQRWREGCADEKAASEPLLHLFFNLPRGITAVTGGVGRSDVDSFGGEVSFFGFFAILLLRCWPFGMGCSSWWRGM